MIVVYFDQLWGASPLNAGQNLSKMLQNTKISLISEKFRIKEEKSLFLGFESQLSDAGRCFMGVNILT